MYFHIACPQCLSDFNFCIKEIRAGVCVMLSCLNDFNRFAIGSFQVVTIVKFELPEMMEKVFLHGESLIAYTCRDTSSFPPALASLLLVLSLQSPLLAMHK